MEVDTWTGGCVVATVTSAMGARAGAFVVSLDAVPGVCVGGTLRAGRACVGGTMEASVGGSVAAAMGACVGESVASLGGGVFGTPIFFNSCLYLSFKIKAD